ncbi:hypothetical protein ACFQL7_20825 [Halocatena marina]|uniref:Uncharacterized protein n=2 Tax=Halocatena marina TaxID=2934937 RepID=A0ABD5YS42_9EURY
MVNVVVGGDREPREMEYVTSGKNQWVMPNTGDIVEIHYVDREPIATSVRNPYTKQDPNRTKEVPFPKEMGEGDYCFQFNEGTGIRFKRNADDTYDLILACDGKMTLVSGEYEQKLDPTGMKSLESTWKEYQEAPSPPFKPEDKTPSS